MAWATPTSDCEQTTLSINVMTRVEERFPFVIPETVLSGVEAQLRGIATRRAPLTGLQLGILRRPGRLKFGVRPRPPHTSAASSTPIYGR